MIYVFYCADQNWSPVQMVDLFGSFCINYFSFLKPFPDFFPVSRYSLVILFTDCSDPAPVDGSVNTTMTTYGTVAEVVCNNGHLISGSSIITCQADETWSDSPVCNPTGKPKLTHMLSIFLS